MGLISILFDLLFLVQHYILYRNAEDISKNDNNNILNFDNSDSDSFNQQQSPNYLTTEQVIKEKIDWIKNYFNFSSTSSVNKK